MRTHTVEWIGVKSPTDNPVVEYRLLLARRRRPGGYTPQQVHALQKMARRCVGLIRSPGFVRILGPKDGLSKTYKWSHQSGWRCQVLEIDAERLEKMPVAKEFRDHDNPLHDERRPSVPQSLMTRSVFDVLVAAQHAAPLELRSRKALRRGDPIPSEFRR